MRTLKQINAVYERIIHCDELNERVKGMKLASLMSEMEKDFKIPAQRNEAWELENKAVLELYSKILMSRNF
ncbi:hypothetical protein AB4X15_15785 [Peribacillus simplex]|uniref:hypothetical protein n=1 Tax=Peribacillus simplex TaxID=1478 RepID=UPI0034E8EE68